jgi:hypothetical protein
MYILQSILDQAGAVWQTETLAMPLRKADKVIKERLANATGVRRFRLIKA